MPILTSSQMLRAAQHGKYGVGAFNCENMEMVLAIVAAAEEKKAPVILQTTPSTLRYASPDIFAANIIAAARNSVVPVAVHLDHGSSYALAVRALMAGYTSIMIDGSQLLLDENILVTKQVAEMCHAVGIPVEGELGRVGGKEDDTESEGCGYTDPDEAVRFAAETGVDSMAVGIGTSHGVYASAPVLNLDLVSKLRSVLDIPLVLHGASGLSDDAVRECVARGMSKVNYATELRCEHTKALREYLTAHPECIDPKQYGTAAMGKVKELVMGRMEVLGCVGKAADAMSFQ